MFKKKITRRGPLMVINGGKDQFHAESNSKFKNESINCFDMLKFIADECVHFWVGKVTIM